VKKIAQFLKVSEENFVNSVKEDFPMYTEAEIRKMYEDIKLPARATRGSAGYDFYAPFDFQL